MKAIQIIQHSHVEGRSNRALLFVTTNVNIMVISATVGEPVDQPRVGVVGEDNRLVSSK